MDDESLVSAEGSCRGPAPAFLSTFCGWHSLYPNNSTPGEKYWKGFKSTDIRKNAFPQI